MNKRSLLVFLLCVVIMSFMNGIVAAQDSLKNSLGISFGLSNLHILDVHASDLLFRGTGFAPSIEYNRNRRKNLHILKGSFYCGKLSPSSDNYLMIRNAGQIQYSYLRTLFDRDILENHFDVSAGVSFSSTFMESDYLYYRMSSWATVIKSWYGSYSAGITTQLTYDWRQSSKIKLIFNMPLVSNVSRPEYSASGDYNYEKNDWQIKAFGNTRIIPENLVFNTRFSYEHRLFRRFIMKAEYEFYFAKCDDPDRVKFYMNNLRIGILYTF